MADSFELAGDLYAEAAKLDALADLVFREHFEEGDDFALSFRSSEGIQGLSMLLGDIAGTIKDVAQKVETFDREKPSNGKEE